MFMSDAAERAERHGRILAELSELGLALARKLQAAAVAAQEPKVAAELGLAFHRISRSVRQSLALEARLERERERDAREAARAAAAEAQTPRPEPEVLRALARRKAEVRDRVERLAWAEFDLEDAEDEALEFLETQLDALARSETFLFDPIEHQVRRLWSQLERQLNAAGAEPEAKPPNSS